MPNREHRRLRLLGKAHQTRRAFPHLTDVAGCALEIARENRLNRIDNDCIKPLRAGGGDDRLEQRLVQQRDVFGGSVQALSAQLHLERGFLTRHVQGGVPELLEPSGDLKKQRRLADARLTTDQNHRTRDDPAAEHEIEFLDSRLEAASRRALDVTESGRRRHASAFAHRLLTARATARRSSGRSLRRHLFDQ
jgi:hypothetical protein